MTIKIHKKNKIYIWNFIFIWNHYFTDPHDLQIDFNYNIVDDLLSVT